MPGWPHPGPSVLGQCGGQWAASRPSSTTSQLGKLLAPPGLTFLLRETGRHQHLAQGWEWGLQDRFPEGTCKGA